VIINGLAQVLFEKHMYVRMYVFAAVDGVAFYFVL